MSWAKARTRFYQLGRAELISFSLRLRLLEFRPVDDNGGIRLAELRLKLGASDRSALGRGWAVHLGSAGEHRQVGALPRQGSASFA